MIRAVLIGLVVVVGACTQLVDPQIDGPTQELMIRLQPNAVELPAAGAAVDVVTAKFKSRTLRDALIANGIFQLRPGHPGYDPSDTLFTTQNGQVLHLTDLRWDFLATVSLTHADHVISSLSGLPTVLAVAKNGTIVPR